MTVGDRHIAIVTCPRYRVDPPLVPRLVAVLIDTRFGEVVVVPTDFAVLARRACELAGRELTVDEWQTYVGDRPQVACGSAE